MGKIIPWHHRSDGVRLVASFGSNVAYLHKQAPWWQGAFNKGVGQPYIGNITFTEPAADNDEQAGTYTFALALPIIRRWFGKGTGLGLHNVREIIKKYRGGLTVDTKVGTGTTFTIEFPNTAII